MRVTPSKAVLNWLNGRDAALLYLTTITIAEIVYGLRILADGKRRRLLADSFERFVAKAFVQRILCFDEPAARCYGDIMGRCKEMGRPISVPDGQILAIGRAQGFAIATRNSKDFEDCGTDLINPFNQMSDTG